MERRRDEVLGADPLVRGRAGGRIHCLPIPTPFAVGRVNCYLIEDDPLTLVDTGPNSGKALDELERALAARGHAIEDLELIVVTHQHIDHIGLVEILARRSGAEVAALDPLAPLPGALRRATPRPTTSSPQALMLRHGIPEDVAQALRSRLARLPRLGRGAHVTRPLRDGDAARAARPHAAGPAPPRPQPVGHGLLGRASGACCSPATT